MGHIKFTFLPEMKIPGGNNTPTLTQDEIDFVKNEILEKIKKHIPKLLELDCIIAIERTGFNKFTPRLECRPKNPPIEEQFRDSLW